MKPMKFGIGQPVKRVEDAKFITGAGHYTADLVQPKGLIAGFLRSPHAHARFSLGDLGAVKQMPGVALVLTAEDVAHLGGLPCLAPLDNSDGSDMPLPRYPLLAEGTVRHVGDAVAMVVAETDFALRDAIEALPVDFDVIDAVPDMQMAVAEGATPIWPDIGSNVAYDKAIGDKAATDAVFASAAHVVSLTVDNHRLVANFMEPRAAFGEIDQAGRYVLTTSSQGVHGLRDTLAGSILKTEPDNIRVITPDVGGGFGTKTMMYREYPLLLEAAKRCGKRVGWVADRTEHFLGDAQGRDNHTTAEMALDADGRFLAIRVDILGNLGAYLVAIRAIHSLARRHHGDGRLRHPGLLCPRARRLHEYGPGRCLSRRRPAGSRLRSGTAGRQLRTRTRHPARETLRARNFVPSAKMPYKTQTDRTYDVGDFEGAMRQALERADVAGIEERVAQSKASGKAARPRLFELHRVHRLGRGRGRLGHARAGRHVHGAGRHAIERAGACDSLRPDGVTIPGRAA